MDESPHAAAYGLACEACARAKCKCVVQSGGRCERCGRLDKICQPTKSKRQLKSSDRVHNSRVEKSRSDVDVSRLERKLDQLVAQLKGQQQSLASPSNSDASTLIPSPVHSDDISPTEAEETFMRFRRYNAKFFPYLSLPGSARELQRDRPALWACVMAISARQRAKQHERIARVQEMLSTRILVRAEGSIDLLLAVLCFIGWAHMAGKHPVTIKATITIFAQLAVAMVYELRLNTQVASDPPQLTCIPPVHMRPPQRPPRTLEECRAVMGTFVVISTFTTAFKRSEPMRWTSHMQDCLAQIEAQDDDPLDRTLVHCVRIQLIADKAMKAASHDVNVDPYDSLRPPPSLFAQEMLTQLGTLKSAMVDALSQDATVQLQLHAASISINELALYGDPTAVRLPNIHRTRHLHACTQAIKSWCDVFLSIPIAEINGMCTSNMMQMRHVMGLLYVLTNIDEPGWTKEDAASIIDLYSMLDQLAENFAQVPAAIDFRGDIDTAGYEDHWWTHVANTVRTLRSLWSGQDERGNVAMGGAFPSSSSTAGVGAAGAGVATTGEAINLEGMEFDIPGLDWLMDPAMMGFTM
ncbi:hypothetical protein Q7P35_002940 [Cladosporium inversicolor]